MSPSLVEMSFFKGKLEDINESVWKRHAQSSPVENHGASDDLGGGVGLGAGVPDVKTECEDLKVDVEH